MSLKYKLIFIFKRSKFLVICWEAIFSLCFSISFLKYTRYRVGYVIFTCLAFVLISVDLFIFQTNRSTYSLVNWFWAMLTNDDGDDCCIYVIVISKHILTAAPAIAKVQAWVNCSVMKIFVFAFGFGVMW